jgi:peroxiredoxin
MAAYQRQSDARRFYTFAVAADGTFRVEDVIPGRYDLIVRGGADTYHPDGRVSYDALGVGGADVTVGDIPGGRSDQPQDVGAVVVTVRKLTHVGDAAPPFTARTLDGKDLKLTDYRGKYVLLNFWAAWSRPSADEVPRLKALYEAFGKDERFVMLGLSVDATADEARAFADKNGLRWPQAHVGSVLWSPVTAEYGINDIPAVWLIGPDGKVVAKDLRGDEIKAAIGKALATPTSATR